MRGGGQTGATACVDAFSLSSLIFRPVGITQPNGRMARNGFHHSALAESNHDRRPLENPARPTYSIRTARSSPAVRLRQRFEALQAFPCGLAKISE